MPELFIFDWSGVISDDRQPVYEANMRLLEDYGRPRMSFEKWQRKTGLNAVGFLRNCGLECDEKEVLKKYEQYLNEAIEQGGLMLPYMYEGVPDVLEHLRRGGKKLAVMSSHPRMNLIQEAKDYGIHSAFKLISGSNKNKGNGLLRVCRSLGFSGESSKDSLYLGDTVYDVQAAKQAGVPCAACCWGYHDEQRLRAENPEYVLRSLEELRGLVGGYKE